MEKTRSTPDVQTQQPVRISELKLVEKASPGLPKTKPEAPLSRPIEDVEDMWDNLPV